MSEADFPSFSLDELNLTMELASAIAERTTRETVAKRMIAAELAGHEYEEDTELVMAFNLGYATLNLASIGNPGEKATAAEVIETIISFGGAKGLTRYIKDASVDDEVGIEVDEKALEAKAADYYRAKAMDAMGGKDLSEVQVSDQEFRDVLTAAEVVAAERGVRTPDVYLNDDYYYEAYRRAVAIDYIVASALHELWNITEEREMTQAKLLLETIPEELTSRLNPEEVERMSAEYLESDELATEIAESVANQRETVRQNFLLESTLVYGHEATEEALDLFHGALKPTRPLAFVVLEKLS